MITIKEATRIYNISKTFSTLSTPKSYLSTRTSLSQQKQHDQLKVFRDNAAKWWNGKEFSILRSMNELRVPFIKNGIEKPLEGSKLLDVGCGGGILSEPLARLGATVLGIDPVFESINQAQIHAQADVALKDRLRYLNCNIEDISAQKEHVEQYDAVIASEVLEHIEDIENFLIHCNKVIKPNGSLFVTTINQTPLSWLGVIFFGEYILQQLPKGTHSYDMFVSVKGLRVMLERLGFHVKLVNGFMYEPVGGKFYWTPTTLTHYAMQAVKKAPIARNLNHQQKRYLRLSENLNKAKSSKIQKPKNLLDKDDMMSVIPYVDYEEKSEKVLSELRSFLESDLTTRATVASIDKLKITLEGLNEPLELRDIAQISMKGTHLIIIDLSTSPEAIKPTMEALTELGNMNPQTEVNNIYVQIPRVTREHRERLAQSAKQNATKSKDKLRRLFTEYSSKAKSHNSAVSSDMVHGTVETLKYEMDTRLRDIDAMVQKKVDQLLVSQ